MSDYASCVTEPFWQSEMPEAYAHLAAIGWTEIAGDKRSVAFAAVLRDLSENGLVDQFMAVALDLHPLIPADEDLHLCMLGSDRVLRTNARKPKQSSVLRTSARKAKLSYDKWVEAKEPAVQHDHPADDSAATPALDAFLG